MSSFSADERQALADALEAAGSQAPTLCEGWTAHDLAAHLVARERRPDSGPGLLVPFLAGWTERVRRHYRERPFEELVADVRSGPFALSFFALPGVDANANLAEHFVHCEDVRRGREPWTARELDPALEDRLWRVVRAQARLSTRRSPVGVVLERTGPTAGGETADAATGSATADRVFVGGQGPHVTLRGRPSELLLHLFNRTSATLVELDGPPALVEQFRTVKLGL